jgi:anti-sigma-K factor RskA
MTHERILAKASEYSAGTLEHGDRVRVERHLETCAECRALLARWKAGEPSRGFTDRVMARLPVPEPAFEPASAWSRRFPVWGTVAAAAMVVAAFWHPENTWVRSDYRFALWDSPHTTNAPSPAKGAHHD